VVPELNPDKKQQAQLQEIRKWLFSYEYLFKSEYLEIIFFMHTISVPEKDPKTKKGMLGAEGRRKE
jgi:hypothetical protein